MTATPEQTMDQIIVRLNMFSFWNMQTVHSKGKRRIECEIRAQEDGEDYRKVYRASRATAHDACRAAIAKATAKIPNSSKLKIAK